MVIEQKGIEQRIALWGEASHPEPPPVSSMGLPAFGKAETCLPSLDGAGCYSLLAQGGAGGLPVFPKASVWFPELRGQISSHVYFIKEKRSLGFRFGRHFREQLIL